MRLSAANMAGLPARVLRPTYDRAAQKTGIVHFGIGAFHRAHQAVTFDDAMNAGERDWSIIGVSLRSANVAEQLNPQDGLYTLAIRSGDAAHYRLVGAVKAVLVASQQRQEVVAAIASQDTHIVTFTITEKGYCRAPDGTLDKKLAQSDCVYSLLAEGLARRMAGGSPGLTLLSCDNLANNGEQLKRLLLSYLNLHNPMLAKWVAESCTFPCSMVDRIVPATADADLVAAQAALNVRDEATVGTEPFSQWVIEDKFAGPRPRLEDYCVQIVADVAPYETAKLRMLNGAHSALAYIGLRHGHHYVHQAVADPAIRPLIERLMRDDAAPSIAAAPDQNLDAYADALLARFENCALNHSLIQIAMDGSQKIPQRWLETLAWHKANGRQCPSILSGIAAWLLHIRGDVRPVDDPLAEQLALIWQRGVSGALFRQLFGDEGLVASKWVPDDADVSVILRELEPI